MCTVSWLVENNDYHVFFNRDEQRSRSLAIPPQVIKVSDTQALMPIDPDGNGSWISTNEFGLTLCLLNYYQGTKPQGVLISRGLLLKNLSAYSTVECINEQLQALSLNQYASFSLLAFGLDDNNQVIQQTWQWNGETLTAVELTSPFTSSSVKFDEVSQSRLSTALELATPLNVDALIDYHQKHQPAKGYLSVCMHRDDAKSVSFSHIHVGAQQTVFNYKNGSPCSNEINDVSLLVRK